MANLTIRVLNSTREPLRGVRARFEYIGRHYDDGDKGRFFDVSKGWSGEARTNEEGYTYFSDFNEKSPLIKLYLNNKFVGRDYVHDGGRLK